MQQQSLLVESLEEAFTDAVQVLGGSKVVGLMLWPEKSAKSAMDLLNHCLDVDRPEKLDLSQQMLILRKARAAGCHSVMAYMAKELAYEFTPISRESQVERLHHDTAKLATTFAQQMKLLQEQAARINELTADPVFHPRRAA